MPSHVGVCAISVVHCVSASTNTRSKNSSSGVTRSSSRITAVTRGRRWRCDALTPPSSQPAHPGPAGAAGRGTRARSGRRIVLHSAAQCSDMFGSPAALRPVPEIVHVPPFGVPAL